MGNADVILVQQPLLNTTEVMPLLSHHINLKKIKVTILFASFWPLCGSASDYPG